MTTPPAAPVTRRRVRRVVAHAAAGAGSLPWWGQLVIAMVVVSAELSALVLVHNQAIDAQRTRAELTEVALAVAHVDPDGPSQAAAAAGSAQAALDTVAATGVDPALLAPVRASLTPEAVARGAPVAAAVSALDARLAQRAQRAHQLAITGFVLVMAAATASCALLFRRFVQERQRAERRRTEQHALARSEDRFRALVANASDVVTVIGADTAVLYQGASVERVLGYEPEAMIGRPLADFAHPDDVASLIAFVDRVTGAGDGNETVECRFRHRAGAWVHLETRASDLRHVETVGGIVLTSRDVSERKALERRLDRQALHDPLTGLANRQLFGDRLAHTLAQRGRDVGSVATLLIDLDGFKFVNDTLGHGAGDALLGAVAERLRAGLGAGDTAARLGGDEFAVVLESVTGPAEARDIAGRLGTLVAEPVRVADRQLRVQASIGIAVGRPQDARADELLRRADVAMYLAKKGANGKVVLYEPELHAAVLDRRELKTELAHALGMRQLSVHYQPTVVLDTGQIAGVEALVRWHHPTRGFVAPSEFIPLAEETGLINELGRWVLERACEQTRRWQEEYPSDSPLTVSVNLSAMQLQHDELVDEVRAALEHSGLDPRTLILEITESVVLAETDDLIQRLDALKQLGLRLAIDDFGTGYSSLSYLRRLPVDILKIDKAFVDHIGLDREDAALASAIVKIAETLKLQTVAEGIEAEAQAGALRRLRCDYGQGYLFARPADQREISALLASANRNSELSSAGSRSVSALPRR